MKPTIEEVAARGMERVKVNGQYSWRPCPACGAEKRGKHDLRGPVDVTRCASSGPLTGQPAWYCRRCEVGGGTASLAKALGHDELDGWDADAPYVPPGETAPPSPAPAKGSNLDEAWQAPTSTGPELFLGADAAPVLDTEADEAPLDVAGGWAALVGKPSTWRRRLHGWMQPRRYTRQMADAIEASGAIALVPVGAEMRRLPPAARRLVRATRTAPYDVLMALRNLDGEVVDIERRWRPEHRPPECSKTKRCSGEVVGSGHGTVMFGRLPAAVEVGLRGEPIIIVEGSTDYIAAYGAVAARGMGAVLGAPGAEDLPKVARALVNALQAADAIPGAARVYVVPDVGDRLDNPQSKGWRIGERRGWAAAVELLEVARAFWCPPVDEGTGDLCDHMLASKEPVRTFWRLIGGGMAVLDVGRQVDRWRHASAKELRRHAWRLPLKSLLEYLRWYTELDKDGKPILKRGHYLPHTREGSGDDHLSEVVLHWLDVQDISFISSDEGLFIWDPIERARRPPHEPGDPIPKRRNIPRLVRVGSQRYWDGWLSRVGSINRANKQGKAIATAIKAAAQDAPISALASWLTADGELHAPTFRLHTHTPLETVLTAGPGFVDVEPNGAAGRILLKSPDVEAPFHWVRGIAPADASRLLYATLARHLTFDAPERALAMAWLLLAPIRELMKDLPILWATGAMSSGKSFGVSLINGALYGFSESGTFTTAALWEAGQREPLVSLDNKENSFIDDTLLELLLTASTGTKRRKRNMGGELGNVSQRFQGLIYLTAISRPTRPDLQRRVLLVHHDKRFRNEVHRSAEVIAELSRQRSALWSGVAELYAHRITPLLAQRAHTRYADRIGPDHPIEGMREALGVMAVIGDVLCRELPVWGPGGDQLFDLWLALTSRHIRAVRGTSDPIGGALDELYVQWNRLAEDRYSGQKYRPAFTEARFVCQPLFEVQPERRPANGDRFTLDIDHGLKDARGVVPVVGFVGTYGQLYRDLLEANRYSAAFNQAVDSAETLGARIGSVEGWGRELFRKPRNAKRVYRWFRTDEDG